MAENCLADGNGAIGDGSASAGPEPGRSRAVDPKNADSKHQEPIVAACTVADVPRLVAEHAGALYRYAFRLTGAAADAEDLTQQTFLIAHRKMDQLREVGSARVWLMTVMRRTYCRSRVKNRTEREKTVPLDVDTLPADEVSDPWEIDGELLQAAIDDLPDEFKLVLLSFYFENLCYREIAEQFEIPIGTVMSRLARAKSHLRSRLFEAELQAIGPNGVRINGAAQGRASRDGSFLPRSGGA